MVVVIEGDAQRVLELLGIFAFATSGAIVAVRKGFDIVGILALAWITCTQCPAYRFDGTCLRHFEMGLYACARSICRVRDHRVSAGGTDIWLGAPRAWRHSNTD